jgi:hypothetical protein
MSGLLFGASYMKFLVVKLVFQAWFHGRMSCWSKSTTGMANPTINSASLGRRVWGTLQVCNYSFGMFLWMVIGERISAGAHCLKSTTGTAVQQRQQDEHLSVGNQGPESASRFSVAVHVFNMLCVFLGC